MCSMDWTVASFKKGGDKEIDLSHDAMRRQHIDETYKKQNKFRTKELFEKTVVLLNQVRGPMDLYNGHSFENEVPNLVCPARSIRETMQSYAVLRQCCLAL